MDSGKKSLINVLLSVLAPVLILEKCSGSGGAWYDWGTVWALVVALSLPIGCGVYSVVSQRRVEPLAVFGLLGTLLTGVVSMYANSGSGEAIRPDTPWWYAGKELMVATMLAGAVLVTARGRSSLLRAFVYSEALYDIPLIEQKVQELGCTDDYRRLELQGSRLMAASLLGSGLANFGLSLYFLLPVLQLPAADQALAYNQAVGGMHWWGFVVIGVPLMATLVAVMRFLARRLQALTGLPADRIFLK